MTASFTTTWEDALREFLIHVEATRARKTFLYYRTQLTGLSAWCQTEEVTFDAFGKRHLDRYLVYRQKAGMSQLTLHHDAICAKSFLAWCAKNDLLERSPLAEYRVRKAPTPPKHMPTDDEMVALLRAVPSFWNPRENPDARYFKATKRAFHRDRNYAILLGLLDTACRIGEMLAFKVTDYAPAERRITVRESKGRESRVLPVSAEWADALDVWLRVRARVMAGSPDEGWLFVSESGGPVGQGSFLCSLKAVTAYAGLTEQITLHSLRRYSLNKLSKVDVLGAQRIAGHKDTKTTLIYTRIDPDHVRDVHERAGVVKGIVLNPRLEREKRRRLV